MSSDLNQSFHDLRTDLLREEGPQISTMRSYRYAILTYPPEDEFKLRGKVQGLMSDLTAGGWVVLTISLQKLLLRRLRSYDERILQRMIEMERNTAKVDPERGLNYLSAKLEKLLPGPDGIAADVSKEITDFVSANPDMAERTLVLLGRAGALYPFVRASALLKHIDGRTQKVPVVLLYPGHRSGDAGLSFMSEKDPDRDYRPRIY